MNINPLIICTKQCHNYYGFDNDRCEVKCTLHGRIKSKDIGKCQILQKYIKG
jgi:hypothetical protein